MFSVEAHCTHWVEGCPWSVVLDIGCRGVRSLADVPPCHWWWCGVSRPNRNTDVQ